MELERLHQQSGQSSQEIWLVQLPKDMRLETLDGMEVHWDDNLDAADNAVGEKRPRGGASGFSVRRAATGAAAAAATTNGDDLAIRGRMEECIGRRSRAIQIFSESRDKRGSLQGNKGPVHVEAGSRQLVHYNKALDRVGACRRFATLFFAPPTMVNSLLMDEDASDSDVENIDGQGILRDESDEEEDVSKKKEGKKKAKEKEGAKGGEHRREEDDRDATEGEECRESKKKEKKKDKEQHAKTDGETKEEKKKRKKREKEAKRKSSEADVDGLKGKKKNKKKEKDDDR